MVHHHSPHQNCNLGISSMFGQTHMLICMLISMYIYICVLMCKYIHTYIHTYIYILYIYIHIYIYYIYIYIHTIYISDYPLFIGSIPIEPYISCLNPNLAGQIPTGKPLLRPADSPNKNGQIFHRELTIHQWILRSVPNKNANKVVFPD